MSRFALIAYLVGTIFLTSCASGTGHVQTLHVDKAVYSELSCSDLKRKLADALSQISAMHSTMNNAAGDDVVQVAVGMSIFWPALLLVEGGNISDSEKYAALKGQVIAMRDAAFEKDCEFTNPSKSGVR